MDAAPVFVRSVWYFHARVCTIDISAMQQDDIDCQLLVTVQLLRAPLLILCYTTREVFLGILSDIFIVFY